MSDSKIRSLTSPHDAGETKGADTIVRQMKWLRHGVVVMIVVATAGLLLGCSGGASTGSGGGTEATQAAEPAVTITISAAASLTDALNDVTAAYTALHPEVDFDINYGASGTLQEQISQGAVADVFLSASKKYMDAVEEQDLVVTGTRLNLLANELVVVVPKDSGRTVTGLADLLAADYEILALGEPNAVPAGKYAQQALAAAGVGDAAYAKAVLCKDVKEVLTYVETGDVDAGIVYKTDALVSDGVTVAFTIPSDTHDPIVYPAAILTAGDSQEAAQAFMEYLSSDEAMNIFEGYGFSASK